MGFVDENWERERRALAEHREGWEGGVAHGILPFGFVDERRLVEDGEEGGREHIQVKGSCDRSLASIYEMVVVCCNVTGVV